MPARDSRHGALQKASGMPKVLLAVAAVLAPERAMCEDDFIDISAESGLEFVYFNGMSGELYFAEMMGGGAALFDYDGDGDLDVYVTQGEMLGDKDPSDATLPPPRSGPPSDRLFRNDIWLDGEGDSKVAFVDVTQWAGIPPGGYGMGVASGDFDASGLPDLYVTGFGPNRLLLNRGDGTFEDATESSGTDERRWSVAASPFDFDGDGLLDLYVGNYTPYRIATHRNCLSDTGVVDYCGPLGSEPDRLFHNLGGGAFEDVSRRSGIGLQTGAGLGSVTNDFDGDGRVDLFVANDGDRNHLWLNQGDGTFVDEAVLLGTAVNLDGRPEASMGVVVGDLNGDGHDDLFMSHLVNETNTFYMGSASGLFDDASNDSGLGLPSWQFTGFGVALFDYDNDADLDLFVANGAVKRIQELVSDDELYPLHQINQLFRNEGDGRFSEVTAEAGATFALSEVSRGVAKGDVDNDGDIDLVVINSAGPLRLLSNRVGQRTHWIGVSLRSAAGAATPIGSEISIDGPPGLLQRQRVSTDGSYASANDPRRLFGLGPAGGITWVEVDGPASNRRFMRPRSDRLLVVPPGGRGDQ